MAVLRMAGRCRSGGDGAGSRFHLVPDGTPDGWERALCGARPGRRGNGWSDERAPAATCPRCLKLERARPAGE